MQVRSIRPSDDDNYCSVLARTSDADRYCRFFHFVDHFDAQHVRRFVEPQPDVVGFIAVEDERPLGVAHAFLLPDGAAELAIVVAADARRRGVGAALLEHVVRAAHARGWRRLVAYALHDNGAFKGLATAAGMRRIESKGNVVTWELAEQAA
jgi:acetyltransferase